MNRYYDERATYLERLDPDAREDAKQHKYFNNTTAHGLRQ